MVRGYDYKKVEKEGAYYRVVQNPKYRFVPGSFRFEKIGSILILAGTPIEEKVKRWGKMLRFK